MQRHESYRSYQMKKVFLFYFSTAIVCSLSFITYSVFLNSSGIGTVYGINEGKGFWQILGDDPVHDI